MNNRPRAHNGLYKRIARFIYEALGDDWGGTPAPPGATQKFEWGEMDRGKPMYYATTYNNDGHELWFGHRSDRWIFHCRAGEARQLAWFVLWDWWICATWFGVKRRLWYWALHRIG